MCHPLVGRLVGAVSQDAIRNNGCVIYTGDHRVVPSIKASLFWGLYESAEIRFVRKYLRSDLDVVELGSSIGVVAAQVGRKLQPERQLVCVEANIELLELVRLNVARNSSHVRTTVIHGALDYQASGSVTRLRLGDRNIDSSITDDPGGEAVPIVTLAGILSQQQIGDYVLVCDIEGAEAGILEIEKQALARCQQMIIELHASSYRNRTVTVDGMCQALRQRHGFVLRDYYGPVCVFDRQPGLLSATALS